MDKKNIILESQIREIYARVVWTHKTYEKAFEIFSFRNSVLKISEIVLSTITTTGILVTVFGQNKIVGVLSALVSFILLLIKTLTKNYDLGEIAEKYSNAANLLLNIREKYLSLITDINSDSIDYSLAIEQRNLLQDELLGIYKKIPKSFNKAYKKAREAIKDNEEFTFSSNEIDLLLPKSLRRNK